MVKLVGNVLFNKLLKKKGKVTGPVWARGWIEV